MTGKPDTDPDPTRDVAACTCANLRKAARAVSQAYDAALRPAGLKATQFTILAALYHEGPETISRLAGKLVIERTALSRNLKPLERDGLIRIEAEDDRRVRTVSLTGAGTRAFEAARPVWAAVQAEIADRLGVGRWSGLIDDLSATVDAARSG